MTDTPQLENGYTRIANELLDAIIRLSLPAAQMQCLLVVIRKTYGFNKKEDCIPLIQFEKATGIRKQHVCRAISNLESRGIIKITKNGNKKATTYSFNKKYETWKSLPKLVKLPKLVMGVTKIGNKSLPNLGPSKDNTKDTLSKDKNITAEKFSAGPPIDYKKEIARMRERYPNQELLDTVLADIARTRSRGTVSDSIVYAEFKWWSTYPVSKVESGMEVYVDGDHAGKNRGEKYLRGIIRNENGYTKPRSAPVHVTSRPSSNPL